MACYHPLVASRLKATNSRYDPKHKIHIEGSAKEFFISHTESDLTADYFLIPCGNCIGCRIDKARDWSIRICHEASMSSSAYFVTLTYDEEHFGNDVSVHKSVVTQFIKDLRNYFYYKSGTKNIKFFASGEYGSASGRKHYHLILFNVPLDDLVVSGCRAGNVYYESKTLTDIWSNGMVKIGLVNVTTAEYVARYTLKKYGKDDMSKYNLESPFILMSNRPAIGYNWIKANADLVYAEKCVQLPNGKFSSIPKYYLKVLDKLGYDIDPIRAYRKELSFDKEFLDYLHGVDFNIDKEMAEAVKESNFKNRGCL